MAARAPFAGKVALLTGAASGIGRALGQALADQGAHVVLTDVDGPGVAAAAAALMRRSPRHPVHAVRLDVRDGDAVGATVCEVADRQGRLDLLVNNAGISMGGPTHELTGAHWDRIIDTNLRGVVNGVLAAYPLMVAQGHGHIVNTASAAGLAAPPLVVPYTTTKHAVVGLSLGLRPEAALRGVRVSVLCPGTVETPILDAGPQPDLPPTASAPVSARQYLTALGQRAMPADDFARQALRLVARNRAIIVVPRSATAFWYLQRLSPAAVGQVSRTLARRVERTLIRPADP